MRTNPVGSRRFALTRSAPLSPPYGPCRGITGPTASHGRNLRFFVSLRLVVKTPAGVMRRHGGSGRQAKRRGGSAKSAARKTAARPTAAGPKTQVAALARELKEAREQQAAAAEVLKVISRSTFDLHAVFRTLIKSAARLCGADRANISRIHENRFEHVAVFGFEDGYLDYMKAHPLVIDRGSINGRTVLERGIVHVRDVLADPEFTLRDAQRLGGFRTALGVPLIRGGTPIGTMFLARSKVAPFTQPEIDLVATFAAQAVIAIENTRLLSELRARTDDLSESLEQQTAMSQVLAVISKSPSDLKPVFDTILANATRLCEGNLASLWRYDGSQPPIAEYPLSKVKQS